MDKRERERQVLRRFIEVYCRERHDRQGTIDGHTAEGLCEECRELLKYALQRLARCPYDPKPKCKACPTHCYKPAFRTRLKRVMRFSGMYFVKRGRLDWLLRYFLG